MSFDAPGPVVVAMVGEFDISNADLLRSELATATVPGRAVAIEAGELEFADSSVVAALPQCVYDVGPLEIRNASVVFRRIVETSGLTEQLRLTP